MLLLLACASVASAPDSVAAWASPLLVNAEVSGVQFLDARPEASYAAGHIPGAVNVSVEDFPPLDATGAWPDAQAATIPATFASRGLDAGTPIVVVGDPLDHPAVDGALYWVLRYLGRTDVAILDGGLATWLAAEGPLDQEVPGPGDFVGAGNAAVLAITEEVASAEVVVDARDAAAYGEGHIPGAVNVPWEGVLDGGRLRAPEEVAALFADVPDGAVFSGETGIESGYLFFVAELLGREGSANYVGSWATWNAAGLPSE